MQTQFNDPEDALEDSTDTSDLDVSIDDLTLYPSPGPGTRLKSLHPPPAHIHQLWQIYTDRVDPLTKLLHVPTMRPAVHKAASNIEAIPRTFEPLMFSIYAASVMSLQEDECQQMLGEPRRLLLSRYVSATKKALSRAKFMSTINLVVLQALVLHLLSIRDIYEPRAIWSLTGVAVRISHSMGLDRDGEFLGLPPFESELRRRIWWFLKSHDFRTAELCGLAKFRDLDTGGESTKFPTNVNDKQLYPGMTAIVPESNTATDAIFLTLKNELANYAAIRISNFKKQGKDYNQWILHPTGKDQAEIDQAARGIDENIKEIEDLIETKYLRYCDPSYPLHLMTMLVGRTAMNNLRFLSYHPRRWASIEEAPAQERQRIWELSIKILEQHDMAQNNPQLKQFAWHGTYFMQWHVMIHVLDTLRAFPLIPEADRAWQLIGKTYSNRPDMIHDMRKPIHAAISILCLKAYNVREAALQKQDAFLPPTPEFILQIQQQREAAKMKRRARESKNTQYENPIAGTQHTTYDQIATSVANGIDPFNACSPHLFQQSPVLQMPMQSIVNVEDDPFWFINGFDHNQTNNVVDMMDVDAELMLSQDFSMEESSANTINWAQWDAWLANSNVLPPLTSVPDWRGNT